MSVESRLEHLEDTVALLSSIVRTTTTALREVNMILGEYSDTLCGKALHLPSTVSTLPLFPLATAAPAFREVCRCERKEEPGES